MRYLSVLGRLPKISLAELSAVFDDVHMISDNLAVFETEDTPDIDRFGGQLKMGAVLQENLQEKLESLPEGKITLGVSDFRTKASAKSAFSEALRLKNILRRRGRSVRLIPNNDGPILSTATSHHNQLGEKKNRIELAFFEGGIAMLTTQNITSYRNRDQARPARDAKVGMLPPKLAQILVNLCGSLPKEAVVLDPFCGTGTVLQEAILMNYAGYGTDIDARMVEFSEKNLKYLKLSALKLEVADATTYEWSQPIAAVASETYLGPPMSQPPVDIKLRTVKDEVKTVIAGFLKNISKQLAPGTPLALTLPAWKRGDDSYSRLNILDEIDELGYNVVKFKGVSQSDLLYYRDNQIVAREIIVLRKK